MVRLSDSIAILRAEGIVLVEVMVAVALLSMLVVPLVTGVHSALRAASGVRDQSAGLSASAQDPAAHAGWEWGEALSAGDWQPGPTLDIHADSGGGTGRMVGLWADGWYLGEWIPGEDGRVQVGPSAWSDHAGGELVVRVRRSGGPWGPPWRLIIPSTDGLSALSEMSADGGVGQTVAHAPALGNPGLRLSWMDATPEAIVDGLVFVFPFPSPGAYEVELDGRGQSWKIEGSREFDIYF